MGSQVRVLYCPPSSRTKKDIYAKNPEVSATSGFFCAQFLKSEKKISKRVLTKSVDLYLYPRDFGPLFREFFGKAARFCSRQSVEFWLAFLLVLLDRHSECMCHCVDTGKAQNTLQCLGGTLWQTESAIRWSQHRNFWQWSKVWTDGQIHHSPERPGRRYHRIWRCPLEQSSGENCSKEQGRCVIILSD